MVIFFSYPIIVALASWIKNRESMNAASFLSLISMVIGIFLLQDFSTHQFNIIGILFGMLAAICYASYVMGSKHISSPKVNSNVLTTIVCLGCACIFLLLSLLSHDFVFPHSIESCLTLLAFGILATALPIQLMLEGLKYISSMRASIISVLEPLVTVFVGVMLLDESISMLQILGISIILISAVLVQFKREL